MPRARSTISKAKAPKVAEASRLSSSQKQKQDASATLSPAPKGRKTTAQGNALGNHPTTNPSPEGAWPLVAIHDITRHHSGNSKLIKGKLFDSPGPGRFAGFSASGQDVWRDDFDREGDAIIVSAVGARCGKCFIARGQWSAVANTHVVWPDEEKVDLKYLWYLLNDENFWVRSGSAQPFVATRKTFEKEIPLPPLPEQRRIVARIEELFSRLDAGVAALRHAKAQLQRYRQSVLAAAVTGQLTQAWREQHPDTEAAEEVLERILEQRREQWNGRGKYTEAVSAEPLNLALPATWTITNIDSVISGIEAGKNFKCEERPPTEGETGLVKISAVTWGKFDELESKTVTRDDQIREEHVIHSGDFLLSRANTLELVGAPVIVEQITRHLMLSDKVLRLRFVERIEKFALFWLRSKLGRKEIESRATGNQLSMRNIAQGSLRAIPIPLPPLAEQHQIVAEVEARTTAIDHLEAELDRQITRSNRLRQSTLASAFAGLL